MREDAAKGNTSTPQTGDQYYAGTCYERAAVAQHWELDTAEMPYLAHIKSLSNAWPPLRFLADWMEVGTAPPRWEKVRAKTWERQTRASKTNVKMLGFSASAKVEEVDLGTSNELKSALDAKPGHDDINFRLFVVEDLSREVIELLGSRLEIDPFFFREQIGDYNWYNTRDAWAMPPNLTAGMNHRNWFRMRHVRFRYIEDDDMYEKARTESEGFNVFRRPDDDETQWSFMDKPGSMIVMTRTRSSIWIGRDPQNPDLNVGVVLLDPTITQGYPLWLGPANWAPPPAMKLEAPPTTPRPKDLFNLVLQATQSYPWFSSDTGITGIDEQVFTLPTIYTICADWLVACDYLKARLSQIDWEMEKPAIFRSKGEVIDNSLRRLHIFRRILPVFREMVSETIEHALPTATRLTPQYGNAKPHPGNLQPLMEDVMEDFRRVQGLLNLLQERVDRLTAVVASEISTEDSRRGLQENHNLSRLTWLATTFVPLSFVASFFSMTDDISASKFTFGWFFVVAVPLAVVTMVIAAGVGQGWFSKEKQRKTRLVAQEGRYFKKRDAVAAVKQKLKK
ncbi:hypothetical protein M011DRAFT_405978 [Sporormia fimetaria CBS 119925]|uniref:Cora-domain-containing protein n=1 Tax=Sporormia fimetaria CBS 119925 TaxID=1340428 RepID=A0A6A6V7J9_9PLEO|nr:hypothetical protein M011DRAFT_405978 [Sporormia fimetaria CBS 119925]